MGEVRVGDHGDGEVIVFLSGDIDDSMTGDLRTAIDQVSRLEQIEGPRHAIVDMHGVTSLGPAGIEFLRSLEARGERGGFAVSFSTLSAPAHRAVEAAGWRTAEGSPPEQR